jgi:hypothetical protein
MPNIITIPTPCHEDWNNMSPKDQGRHCGSCCKTVVDFTTWQPQEILLHFKSNKNVCGRFTVDQLNEPMPTQEDFVKQISYFHISTIKKMAAIFLFAFMIGASSCNNNFTKGETVETMGLGMPIIDSNKKIVPINTAEIITSTIIDTPPKLMGAPAIIQKPIIVEKPTLKGDIQIVEQSMIMGEPVMVDTSSITKPIYNTTIKENDFMLGKMITQNNDTLHKKEKK